MMDDDRYNNQMNYDRQYNHGSRCDENEEEQYDDDDDNNINDDDDDNDMIQSISNTANDNDDITDEYDEDDDDDEYYNQISSDDNTVVDIQKSILIGGPITAVYLLPIPKTTTAKTTTARTTTEYDYDVLYGQGPYLHHVPHHLLYSSIENSSTISSSNSHIIKANHHQKQQQHQTQPYLVYPNGGCTIHGIRECNDLNYDMNPITVTTKGINDTTMLKTMTNTLLVFGGRQIAFVTIDHNYCYPIPTTHNDNEMDSSTFLTSPTTIIRRLDIYENDKNCHRMTNNQTTTKVLLDDWIWDCRMKYIDTKTNETDTMNTTNNTDNVIPVATSATTTATSITRLLLIIGMAHQQIDIWSVQIINTTTEPKQHHQQQKKSIDPYCSIQIHRLLSIHNSNSYNNSYNNFHNLPIIVPTTNYPKCICYCMNMLYTKTPPPLLSHHRDCGSNSNISNTTSSINNHNRYDVLIATGTVSNEICIFTLSLDVDLSNNVEVPNLTCRRHNLSIVQDHDGVITAVQFHKSGQYILSASDDRTVRLFEKTNQNTANVEEKTNSSGWKLKWTAYGHTARVFDVKFCDLSSSNPSPASNTMIENNINLDRTVVLSTGEDRTLRIWDFNGNALAVLRGHSCQCIWNVATIGSYNNTLSSSTGFTVTGGNNGTVAVYNIRDAIPSVWWQQQATNQQSDNYETDYEGSVKTSFLVPKDHGNKSPLTDNVINMESKVLSTTEIFNEVRQKSKKIKNDYPQQVIVGMKFTNKRYGCVENDDQIHDFTPEEMTIGLIVATRSGLVWHLDMNSNTWTELLPWNQLHRGQEVDTNSAIVSNNLSDGCCMCLHPTLPIIAIGTVNGDIILSNTWIRKESNTINSPYTTVLAAQRHRSVQNMKWIRPNILLSFHVQSILCWSFPMLSIEGKVKTNDLNVYTTLTLRTLVKGLAICAALCDERDLLVVGDTRGNVTLFDISSRRMNNKTIDLNPMSTIRECHQKEHVTDVAWRDSTHIISVGNDGHLRLFCLVDGNTLLKLLSIPVGSFTGISKIMMDCTSNILVGGYYGNNYAIVDVTSGYEFVCIDTGGRQRMLDVCVADSSPITPSSIAVATCVSKSDGSNEIQMYGYGQMLRKMNIKHDVIRLYSMGSPMHGESIFDIHIFPLNKNKGIFGILTGSEDCSSKITVYANHRILTSALLPPQVSGIQAVCSCRLTATATVVVVGGKNAVDLFIVKNLDQAKNSEGEPEIKYVGTGRPLEKLSIDHRINSVRSVVLFDESESNESRLLVLSGDSNGYCYAYLFDEDYMASGRIIHKDERPILCLDILHYGDEHCLVFVGGTSGDISVISLSIDELVSHESSITLLTFNAHSMGTNSISSTLQNSSSEPLIVRIVSCGDDQAICCTDIKFFVCCSGFAVEGYIDSQTRVNEASFSALKGIEFIGKDMFAVSGYDQTLTVWRYVKGGPMIKVTEHSIDVGDVNCLSSCVVGNRRRCTHILAVGGAGVEIFRTTITHNSELKQHFKNRLDWK